MARRKTNPAPQTEVISGPRREVAPGDLTPPNAGLPGQVDSEPDPSGVIQRPPVPTESLDQPFTMEEPEVPETPEVPEVPEVPEPEVTHDPLKDTKAKLTKVEQDLAEQKKLTQAVLFNREFNQPPPPPTAADSAYMTNKMLPEEMPGADPEWPAKYMGRQFEVRDTKQQERNDTAEFERFTRENPDFTDYMEDMQLIANRNPGVYVGPRATFALYDKAKTERELKDLQAKQAENRDRAVATGAELAKQTRNQPFVSPRAGGSSVPGGFKFPANFHQLSTEEQKKMLMQAGLVRE